MSAQQNRRVVRAVSALGTAIVVIGGLAACSSGPSSEPSSDEPITIDFWGAVPGLEELVDQWNSENEDIEVAFHRMTGDDSQKVEAAVDAGTGPDLVQLPGQSVVNYVISGWAQDITEYAAQYEDEYVASAWPTVSMDDRVFGLPQDIGPGGMMYREDIFSQHEIDVPTTWDEYMDAARALQAADPDVYIENISPTEIGQWMQNMRQTGGSWYAVDGDAWRVTIDSPESLEVATRWQTLVDEGLVTTEPMWTPEYWALVNNGTIATITYAAWFPGLLAESASETSGLWRVAPMPTYAGSDKQSDTGGAALVVLKGAEHPEETVKFAHWLNASPETQEHLSTAGGLFPASKAGLESEALTREVEFFGGQVINEVFIETAQSAAPGWINGPNYGFVSTAIGDEFSKAVNGEQTFAEALSNAAEATRADLRARGLEVVG